MKKKKLLRRLITAAVVLALLAALVIFVGIPLFSKTEDDGGHSVEILYFEDKAKDLTMENDRLLFSMNTGDTHFSLTDKLTGQVWYSNPQDAADDKIALSANKEALNSTLLVSYATASGTYELNNYRYAIENQTYHVTQEEDGTIRVDYAIGKIEKTYFIPTAITAERFDAFCANMDKNTRDKKVKANYTLYKPEELYSKSDAEEIIALYPEVQNQALYVLKANTKENNKEKLQGYFEKAGYTQEDYELDMQLVAGAKDNTGAVFNVSILYRLDGDDLVVEVPYDLIRCKKDYPLTYLTVLPMFGAGGTQDDGFLLVPEGGGALINFNSGKLSQNSYFSNVYGWDYGTNRNEVVSETKSIFPVFGVSLRDTSFICIMEGAPSYASIQADISMRNNSYNTVNAKYHVLHLDQYNVSAKTAQLVYMFEKEIPHDTIRHRYRFVDGGSYVDMANAYRGYLEQTSELFREKTSDETVPVSLELVGTIDKVVEKAGLPIDTPLPVTTFRQAGEIIGGLVDSGVKNLNVRYTGWANGGVRQKVFSKVKAEKPLGGEEGMKELAAVAEENGVKLFFDGISCFAYDSGLFDGFLTFRDAARYTTRGQVELYRIDTVTYQPSEWEDHFYLVRPGYAKEKAENFINALADSGMSGAAFRDIGMLLSADYHIGSVVTREQTKQMNVDVLAQAKEKGLSVMVKQGNDYVLDYADLITDMDFDGQLYSILDVKVPFYQIALHGTVSYTGKPVNTSPDYVAEILHCAEYGSGLNFTFMAEDTLVLQDTTYTGYYAAYYDNWKDELAGIITRYQSEMAGLNRQRITGHECLDENVYVTTFEDGSRVYVNYGKSAVSTGGIEIPACDYLVIGGDGK